MIWVFIGVVLAGLALLAAAAAVSFLLFPRPAEPELPYDDPPEKQGLEEGGRNG